MKKFWSLKNYSIVVEAPDVFVATETLRQALQDISLELEETGDIVESFKHPPYVHGENSVLAKESKVSLEKSRDYVSSAALFSPKKTDDKPN
jgi:hypothetical protein